MIGSTRRVSVYAFAAPVDLRKSFDALSALVTEQMGRDVMGGEMFLFVSRDRRKARVLFYDGTGMCLLSKRLEDGRFCWPAVTDGVVRLTAAQLQALLEGLDWRRVHAVRPTRVPVAVS